MARVTDLESMSTETGVNSDQTELNNSIKTNILDLANDKLEQSDFDSLENSLKKDQAKELKTITGFEYDKSNYSHLFKSIYTCESGESWTASGTTTVNNDTSNFLAGTQSKELESSTTGNDSIDVYLSAVKDLSLFGDSSTTSLDNDYIIFNFRVNDTSYFIDHTTDDYVIKIVFSTNSGDRASQTATYTISFNDLIQYWQKPIKIRKSEFTLDTFGGWDSIEHVTIFACTSNTLARLNVDNITLNNSLIGFYKEIDKADTDSNNLIDNDDISYISSDSYNYLALGSSSGANRFLNNLFNLYDNYLIISNDVTDGKNKEFFINAFTRKKLNLTADSFPEITNDIDWKIRQPLFISENEQHYYYESGSNLLIGNTGLENTSDSYLTLNDFKPINKNVAYKFRAKFTFDSLVNNQGFFINYVDSDNHIRIYINNNAASSKIKVDLVKDGVITNKFESVAFAISSSDYFYFGFEYQLSKIDLYLSSANDVDFSFNDSVFLYDNTLDVNRSKIGLYSDKQIYFDDIKASILENLFNLFDISASEIKTAYESNSNTNAFTDDHETILDNLLTGLFEAEDNQTFYFNKGAVNSGSSDIFSIKSGSTPNTWLKMNTSGNVAIGDNPTIATGARLYVLEQKTDPTASSWATSNINIITLSGSSTISDAFVKNGVFGSQVITGSGTWDYEHSGSERSTAGVYGNASFTGEGSIDWLVGLKGRVTANNGTVEHAVGCLAEIVGVTGTTPTIDNAYSFFGSMQEQASTTITNYWGVYLEGTTSMAISNQPFKWTGIYMNADGSNLNYAFDLNGAIVRTTGTWTGATRYIPILMNGSLYYLQGGTVA